MSWSNLIESLGLFGELTRILHTVNDGVADIVRDLVTLQSSGYKVRRMCCGDMFPGTGQGVRWHL